MVATTKRGLGRGLEALLVEVPVMAEASLHSNDMEKFRDNQPSSFAVADLQPTHTLPDYRQTVRQILLEEAEALKESLDDLEALIQCYDV